jgi:hypothetical protein
MVALLLHRFVSFDVPFRDEDAAPEQGLARTVPSRMRAGLPKANVSPIWLTEPDARKIAEIDKAR